MKKSSKYEKSNANIYKVLIHRLLLNIVFHRFMTIFSNFLKSFSKSIIGFDSCIIWWKPKQPECQKIGQIRN